MKGCLHFLTPVASMPVYVESCVYVLPFYIKLGHYCLHEVMQQIGLFCMTWVPLRCFEQT